MGSSSCNNQRRRLGRPVACSGYFFANIFADSKKKHADITENWEGKHVSEEGGEKYHFFLGKWVVYRKWWERDGKKKKKSLTTKNSGSRKRKTEFSPPAPDSQSVH